MVFVQCGRPETENMKMKTKLAAGLSAAAAAAGASAQATAIDVSSITDVCTAAGVAVATIGLAVLAVHYGAKVYKWIRSAG